MNNIYKTKDDDIVTESRNNNLDQPSKSPDYIQKYFFDYFLGVFWTIFMSCNIIIHVVVNIISYSGKSVAQAALDLAQILGKTLFPLYCGIDFIRCVITICRIFQNKDKDSVNLVVRSTLLVASTFDVVAVLMGAIIFGYGITNPLAFPGIFVGLTFANVLKNTVLSYQYSQEIALVHAQLQGVEEDSPEYQINHRRLQELMDERFLARREGVYNFVEFTSGVMLLVSLGTIAPIGFAGMFLLATVGIIKLIDAKSNFMISRGMTHLCESAIYTCVNAIKSIHLFSQKSEASYQFVQTQQSHVGISQQGIKQLIQNKTPESTVDASLANKPFILLDDSPPPLLRSTKIPSDSVENTMPAVTEILAADEANNDALRRRRNNF